MARQPANELETSRSSAILVERLRDTVERNANFTPTWRGKAQEITTKVKAV